MNARSIKWIIFWNIMLTVALFVSLAANAVWVQAADDPPVKVATVNLGHVGGDHSESTADVVINGTAPQSLVSATVDLGTKHSHVCLVTATAATDANIVGSKGSVVVFGLNMDDSGSTVEASDRRIKVETGGVLVGNGATTLGFDNLQGTHTFYLSARLPNTQFNDNPTVSAASMTVVCLKKHF
jgi:hypothetical protein